VTLSEIVASAGIGDIGEALAQYLARQRWFGGRGRRVARAEIADAALLDEGPPALLFLILAIAFEDGGHDQYSMPLEIHSTATGADLPGQTFLVTAPAGGAAAFDALGGTRWAALLWRLAAAGARRTTGGGELIFSDRGTDGSGARPDEIRAIGGEQSNTSMVWRDQEFLKYVRRIEAGPPVELEILEALTEVGFAHAPRLLGSVVYQAPAGAVPSAVALLQSFVPGATDGWTIALRSMAELLEAVELGNRRVCSFAGGAQRLGEVTGEMHLCLGSDRMRDDLRPHPVTTDLLREWGGEMIAQLDSVLATDHPLLTDLRRARPRLVESFGALASAGDGGLAIRTHGDYHLGQVVNTAAGWTVLDFEGEPARSPAQRRRRYSPLRDVAGMLRSFDYAAATGVSHRTAGGGTPTSAIEGAGGWWSAQCRTAFLRGYQQTVRGSTLVPGASGAALLRTWELDKAVYELRYELGHRPEWAAVPLRFLLTGA
jgi:trehalose synthase-fused probable maltokinase